MYEDNIISSCSELNSASIGTKFISSLPNLQFTPKFEQYSGYLDEKLFYWYFTSQSAEADNNLIIFLKGELENVYSWTKLGHLLFIDLPTGSGFSQNITTFTNAETSKLLFNLLQNFLTTYNLKEKKIFLVSGEYSSEIVSLMALDYLDSIKQQQNSYEDFRLKGLIFIGIWNEVVQFNSLIDFAYAKGFTGKRDYQHLLDQCPACNQSRSSDCDYLNSPMQSCQETAKKIEC
ncbi:unnamed protein product, partial [Mesorhabditis belari]|uniref:Uncharacterized protein n=1 Tax=Mesorhabditis belari TaxID=2138241 RepID=A0AAF3F7V8_9BILA